MKIASLQLGNDLIEAHNSMWTGEETVLFNGQEVSRQQNVFSGTHHFNVEDPVTGHLDRFRVDFSMSMSNLWGVSVAIYRNDECLLDHAGKRNAEAIVTVRSTTGSHQDYDRSEWQSDGGSHPAGGKEPLYREDDLV